MTPIVLALCTWLDRSRLCDGLASASSSHPLPLSPLKLQVPVSFRLKPLHRRLPDTHCRWAMPQKRVSQYLSTYVTHGRARRLARNHVSGLVVAGHHRENPSIFVRSLLPFCLDRCLARAYLSRIYAPSPSLGQASKYSCSFPPLCIRMFAASLLMYYARLRTRNRAVGATLIHPGLHRYVSPRSRLMSSHSPLASAHSLPLSLSGSEDKNPRTPPLVRPCVRSHLGDVAWFILFYPIPNLRADSISAIYSQNRLHIL